jgi:hypothetical protein
MPQVQGLRTGGGRSAVSVPCGSRRDAEVAEEDAEGRREKAVVARNGGRGVGSRGMKSGRVGRGRVGVDFPLFLPDAGAFWVVSRCNKEFSAAFGSRKQPLRSRKGPIGSRRRPLRSGNGPIGSPKPPVPSGKPPLKAARRRVNSRRLSRPEEVLRAIRAIRIASILMSPSTKTRTPGSQRRSRCHEIMMPPMPPAGYDRVMSQFSTTGIFCLECTNTHSLWWMGDARDVGTVVEYFCPDRRTRRDVRHILTHSAVAAKPVYNQGDIVANVVTDPRRSNPTLPAAPQCT